MSYRPNPDGQGWVTCRDRLVSQLGLWGVKQYSLDCPAAPRYASRFDAAADRAVSVTLTGGKHSGQTITVDRFERPVDNLWALAKGIESIRLNELRGLDDVARQVYAALPAPKTKRDPWEVLGLRPDATPEDINDMYKAKARRLHPDRGGSEVEMAELNAAYAEVRKL